MELKIVKLKDMEKIDELVDKSLNGTAFAYKYFLKLKNVSKILCIYDNNKLLAFMPLFEENNNLNQSTMYVPYGGPVLLYDNNNYRKYFMITRDILNMISKYIIDNYEESSFSFDPFLIDVIPCVNNGFVPEVRYTYVIDLKKSIDEIYNNFGHDRKRDIRRTKNVKIVIDDKLEFFDITKALIWEYNYGDKINFDFVNEYLRQSINNNHGKCFVALKDGKNLGGVAIVWDKKRCYIMYSYFDKEYNTVIPIIYFEIIKYLKENNLCEILDFEGSVFKEIENFNLSFGAFQEIYFNYYYEKNKEQLYAELYEYGNKNEKQC